MINLHFSVQLDKEDLLRTPITPDDEILGDLANAVRRELKMELFGIDVIIDCDAKKYAVIDINAFPGSNDKSMEAKLKWCWMNHNTEFEIKKMLNES